jgi:hypothetical protein
MSQVMRRAAIGALAFLLASLNGATAQEFANADGALLRGLDKMSGSNQDLLLQDGESAIFGTLSVTLQQCRYPVENPASDAFAFMEIHDIRTPEVTLFRGWMTAASPGLSALDHARYDIWVLRCNNN